MRKKFNNKKVKIIKIFFKPFLIGVKTRLENEIGLFFRLYDEAINHNQKLPVSGFWLAIRYLMPTIEALSNAYYPYNDKAPIKFIRNKLKFPYPNLMWEMFRHSLVHTDSLRTAIYKNQKIDWVVSRGAVEHVLTHRHISIDIERLYYDLLLLLEAEIKKISAIERLE